jgi:uncharacterized protein YozE (UPF0346 family)
MQTNDPFANFGIEHLSSQSINLFVSNLPLFIVRYLWEYKSPTNAAMLRGSVIDKAIGEYKSISETQTDFKKLVYWHKSRGVVFDKNKVDKELNNISNYLELGIPYYKNLGKFKSYQKKVELNHEDLPIPIIGYIDLEYENCIRDIKTTAKTPKLTDQVSRQLAIYSTALDKPAFADYLYVAKTKQEVVTFEIQDVNDRINEVYRIALAMMNLLQNNDINALVDSCYPNFADWMWDEGSIEVAKELWRIK